MVLEALLSACCTLVTSFLRFEIASLVDLILIHRFVIPSPTGQQFISCKEASSFLRSYFEGNDADQPRDQKTCSIQQAYGVATEVVSLLLCLYQFFLQFLLK